MSYFVSFIRYFKFRLLIEYENRYFTDNSKRLIDQHHPINVNKSEQVFHKYTIIAAQLVGEESMRGGHPCDQFNLGLNCDPEFKNQARSSAPAISQALYECALSYYYWAGLLIWKQHISKHTRN